MHFTNSITIDRPPGDVFAYVSDLENVPEWNYAIISTRKVSDGPVSVGTAYRQVRSLPRRSEETLQVAEMQPDRRFVVQGQIGPFVGSLKYDVEDIGGRTRLTNTVDLEGRGLMKLAGPVTSARVRDAVSANLGMLKELLENRQTAR